MLIWNNLYRNLIVVVVIGLFFLPIPAGNLWWREAVNSGHTLLFIFLTFIIHHRVKSRSQNLSTLVQFIWVLVLGLVLGVAIELLQTLVQREASLNDLYRNFVGIVAGLCMLAALSLKKSHNHKITVVFLLLCGGGFLTVGMVPLAQLSWHYVERTNAFPVIVDFDSNWSSSFVNYDKGNYPGISIIETEPDWSRYSSLHFSIDSVSEQDIHLILRVHDVLHDQELSDRFNVNLQVKPGLNEFKFTLNQIQHGPVDRELDLTNIEGIILFSRELKDWPQLEVSNMFLE